MTRTALVDVLLGARPADLVVTGARIVDVERGRIVDGGVAVKGGRIAKVGSVEQCIGPETAVVAAGGRYLTPGLIETHLHAYETNLGLVEFARLLLARGTTSVPEAAYGLGQVAGLPAVRWAIDELRATPMHVLLQVPVLAYLQNRELGIPPAPHSMSGADLLEVLDWDGCVGLEEPPWIPIREQDPWILAAIEGALARGQVVMGHGAGLAGADLEAYAAIGVTADHEAVTAEEALERLTVGMTVAMRESDVAHNQVELQRAITEHGADPGRFMFCADVLDPVTAARTGHLDHQIRLAIGGGIDPIAAVQMATVNAARYYRVDHDVGVVAPGRRADLVLVGDLQAFDVQTVVAGGRVVVDEGRTTAVLDHPRIPEHLLGTVRLARPARAGDFAVPAPPGAAAAVVRVIGGELLVSDERHATLPVRDGAVHADPEQDVLKLAMLDRYGRDAPAGVGFLQGYGLRRGAIGTTYNPMYHNVLVAGTDDTDLAAAANALADMGGGFVLVEGGEVVASAPLPICGLLSDAPAEQFVARLELLYRELEQRGCTMASPFHNLAFTAVCGELPFLKLSHEGLFDVERRAVLPTVVEGRIPSEVS